jgi:hypothetical protein
LAFGSAGCSALWGGLAVPAPENCVLSATPCGQGQACNTQTELCEDMLALSQITPAHASTTASTPIRITGVGFTPGLVLKWNGSELSSLTMSSDTELQAVAPASPDGRWQVTVQASRPSGLQTSRSDLFSYDSANPTFSAISPSLPNNRSVFVMRVAPLLGPTRSDVLLIDGSQLLRLLDLSSDGMSVMDKQDLVIPLNAAGLLVGDLNRDGYADILTATQQGIYWLAGGAGQSFAAPAPLHTGIAAGEGLALGDIDHDGVPDLVGVDLSANQPFVVGHGGTTFAELPLPGTPPAISSLAIGELDGQPGDDIVLSFQDTPASTSLGLLPGGAGAQHYVAVPIAACQNAKLQTGRFRGGPTFDLLLTCGDRVQVLTSAGNGTFTPGYSLPILATQSLIGTPVIADFDGDGNQDVLLLRTDSSMGSQQAEALLLQNLKGDGSLSLLDLMVGVPTPMSAVVAAGDLNGDGKPDVMIADRMSGTMPPLRALLNTSR